MKIFDQSLSHPTQASVVRLNGFELPEGGFLVTEDRIGVTTVVATLGLFDTRDAALARARSRAEELQAERYRAIPPAA